MNGEKKKRNTFYRRGVQKVPDDRQEDREADQDEGRAKTVHEEGTGRQGQAKEETPTRTQAKTISALVR